MARNEQSNMKRSVAQSITHIDSAMEAAVLVWDKVKEDPRPYKDGFDLALKGLQSCKDMLLALSIDLWELDETSLKSYL